MITILFLAANPSDTSPLRLDEEIRAIDDRLRRAEFRDIFEIKQQWAVRVNDLQGYFLRHKPNIVHFSGHGSRSSEIILQDDSGNSRPVSTRALSNLFSTLRDNIRCVVLNACYSEAQAQAIAEHVDCVVGMSKAISDSAAISFAASFYQALAYGKSVRTAFDLGCGQIDIEGLDEHETPKLITPKGDPTKTFFNLSLKQEDIPTNGEKQIQVFVESVHTGQRCKLSVPLQASIKWLITKASQSLGVTRYASTGAFVPFTVRWVLVDVKAESLWRNAPRRVKREIHALVVSEDSEDKVKFSGSDLDHLQDIGVYDGIVFHLYAIEDEDDEPPPAMMGPDR